jgi:Glycosyl hydrolase family 63 N-terminal domain
MRFTESRHACDQGDGLDHYTWTQFDAREGGIQVLQDSENNVKVTTELLMVDGGEHGGSWAARIKGEPIVEGKRSLTHIYFALTIVLCIGKPSRTSFIFYAGMEGMGGLDMETDENENVRSIYFYPSLQLNEHVRASKAPSFSPVQHLSLMTSPFGSWMVRLFHRSP